MTALAPSRTKILEDLFSAERDVRRLHAELAESEPAPLVADLAAAIATADSLEDEDERSLRLVRIASLLGEIEGPTAIDLLIDILGTDDSDDPEPRMVAGEALKDHAFDRFKEVALGIERALERLPVGNAALCELPYMLVEV